MARNPNIDRSNWDPNRCWAANRSGKQCKRPPMFGGKVCYAHGGSTPRSKAMVKRKALKAEAIRLGVPAEVDPKDGILNLISRKAGEVQWYLMQIEALKADEDLVWGKTKETHSDNGGQVEYAAAVNKWLQLKNEAEKDLARYAEVALKYDIDERKIELARESVSQVEAIIRFVLARIGLTDKQLENVPQLMREAVKSVVLGE